MLLELIKDQTFFFEIVYIYVNMTYCSHNEKEKKKLPMIYSYEVIMREFPQGPKLQFFFGFNSTHYWVMNLRINLRNGLGHNLNEEFYSLLFFRHYPIQTSMKWISYQISTSYNKLYLFNSGISGRERERNYV